MALACVWVNEGRKTLPLPDTVGFNDNVLMLGASRAGEPDVDLEGFNVWLLVVSLAVRNMGVEV